jgi:hypothetical protein
MSIKNLMLAGLTAIAMLSSGSAAFAKSDLVFIHNASPYHVWTSLEQCQYDLKDANRGCDNFGYKSFCGKHMFSTSSTSNVAKDRWARGQNVKLYANNGSNSVVCNITP